MVRCMKTNELFPATFRADQYDYYSVNPLAHNYVTFQLRNALVQFDWKFSHRGICADRTPVIQTR
jgi:hypothetical protein